MIRQFNYQEQNMPSKLLIVILLFCVRTRFICLKDYKYIPKEYQKIMGEEMNTGGFRSRDE